MQKKGFEKMSFKPGFKGEERLKRSDVLRQMVLHGLGLAGEDEPKNNSVEIENSHACPSQGVSSPIIVDSLATGPSSIIDGASVTDSSPIIEHYPPSNQVDPQHPPNPVDPRAGADSTHVPSMDSSVNVSCEEEADLSPSEGGDSPSDGELSLDSPVSEDDSPPLGGVVEEAQRLHRLRMLRRVANPDLPCTVTMLHAAHGCTVYLVGTAHFSEMSQRDVTRTMQLTQPDVVLVELCSSRTNILSLDEETLLREAGSIDVAKIRYAIRRSGVVQGILHMLLLSMTAHITRELGMAPGGEFRAAFKEAQKIPGCQIHLGDRPISITLQRALGALSWRQKLKLAWHMLSTKDPVSKEDVERCKDKDMLEELLREMTGEYPALSHVFVSERDVFLAHSLKHAARLISYPPHHERVPSVVVGVVGIGHVAGISAQWERDTADVSHLLLVPPPSLAGVCTKWALRVGVAGAVIAVLYRAACFILRPSAPPALPRTIITRL